MIPVYVSAALSFGLLFLGLILQDPPTNNSEKSTATTAEIKNIMGDSSSSIRSYVSSDNEYGESMTTVVKI
jgi:hypothetical protein